MNGASLIAKNLPLQDQFNIIEDLMVTFCEKVALPCFLARDANPEGDAVASANKATLEMSVEYPSYFSGELKDLLAQLLQKDPEQRLCKDVADHAFFSTLDWSILRNDPDPDTIEGSQEAPPFQPGNSLNVEDPDEIGTFPDLPDIVVDPGMFPEASWLYVSETKYQEEVVWLLQYQEKAAPKKSSSFCVIA